MTFTAPLNSLLTDDGVPDYKDRFPNDPRRSDYINAKFYAVTDLHSYLPADVKATFDAKQVALDDDHKVAFFGTSDASSGSGKTGYVYQWQNGTLTEKRHFSMEYPASTTNYWSPMTTDDFWIFDRSNVPDTAGAHSSLSVDGINPSGTLASTTGTYCEAWWANGIIDLAACRT